MFSGVLQWAVPRGVCAGSPYQPTSRWLCASIQACASSRSRPISRVRVLSRAAPGCCLCPEELVHCPVGVPVVFHCYPARGHPRRGRRPDHYSPPVPVLRVIIVGAVVIPAQNTQIRHIRLPTLRPRSDMVNLAIIRRMPAPRHRTRRKHQTGQIPLLGISQTLLPVQVDRTSLRGKQTDTKLRTVDLVEILRPCHRGAIAQPQHNVITLTSEDLGVVRQSNQHHRPRHRHPHTTTAAVTVTVGSDHIDECLIHLRARRTIRCNTTAQRVLKSRHSVLITCDSAGAHILA